ncbi:MAG: dTMP kinase [Candidatus Aenigmarchaeota archaeon]|nr:dTMP kinase [Candidatus Aenigmarchaeota archaeon]
MKGKFIVFEGIDKSGKETQAKKLVEYLKSNGFDAIYTEEPTPNNPIGLLIKEWLDKKIEIHSGEAITLLYAADRYEHLKNVIIPSLHQGKIVVCDRYFYSTIAYESVAFGIDKKWIIELHKGIQKPDVIIFIDIDPEVSLKRQRDKPNDRLEKLELLQKVRNAYKEMIDEFGFFALNGNRPIEEIFNDVKSIVDKILFKTQL